MKDKDIDCTNKKLTEYKTKMMEFEDLQKYWRDKVSQLSFYFKELKKGNAYKTLKR